MGYTLLFKSLTGTDYRLIIDNGGTLITGAASAFETQEDANADMFTPIRTQSGSFRFVGTNDHATWLGMIPTNALSKTVKLYTGSSIQWQGFVQPQVFDNEYPGKGTLEHEIPVQCPLSVLDTVDVDTSINNHPIVTFGQLLQEYIFKTVTDAGITIAGYMIQGTAAVTKSRLDLKVLWANFLDTDSTGSIKPKYTYKQLLEEFCKFFGYTCRMHGDIVYFTMPVDNSYGFTYYGSTKLYDTTQTSPQAGTGSYSASGTFSITDDMLCDTNNHEEVHPGIGKATVRSDINAIDNLIEIPYDELYDQYNVGISSSPIIMRSVDWFEHNIYNQIRVPDANGGTLSYENDTVALSCYMANKPGTQEGAGGAKKYCRFLVYDDGEVGGNLETQEIPESKEAFSWRKCIELFHSYTYSGSNTTPMFTIASKQVFVISDGFLYINFKCHQVSAWVTEKTSFFYPNHDNPTAIKSSCCATARLRVGDKYWNGSSWQQSSTEFDLPFNASGAKSNRSSYGGVTAPQYSGYGVQVTGTMRGDLEFVILDVPSYQVSRPSFAEDPWPNINGFLPLMDFEIGFVRGTIEDTKHRGNEYVKTGGAFRDEVNVDLIFAADVPYGQGNFVRHMPAGLGYILNYNNDRPTATVQSMSGSYVTPEEELARIIAVYGNHTHRLVQLNLRPDPSVLGWNVVPSNKASVDNNTDPGLYDIDQMFPLAISHNWRDDITTLTLIQI